MPLEEVSMSSEKFSPADALGGRQTLGAHLVEEFRRGRAVHLIRSGLPYRAAQSLKDRLRLSRKDLSRYLAVAPRTLARRQASRTLAAHESDRLYRLARVYAKAVQVLGSEEQAVIWLRHPSTALGSVAPLTLLETEEGARQVDNELNGIEYNVYA